VSTCVDTHGLALQQKLANRNRKKYGTPKNILAHPLPIRIQFSFHFSETKHHFFNKKMNEQQQGNNQQQQVNPRGNQLPIAGRPQQHARQRERNVNTASQYSSHEIQGIL
jgi:hypothetical protein